MPGFEVQLEQLRRAGRHIAAAAEKADTATTGAGEAEVPAGEPRLGFFDVGDWITGGGPAHAFGDNLGFDGIAWAYQQHVSAVRDQLRRLRESATATSDALAAVVKTYESADLRDD
ncbi:hypothetical protein [Actinokineospora iranica]|uniref:Excreted virulence factor EspC, type VII ESX diderm n=1 Tax=Actinokineospora iranica TaxID=1271860 RepID=A0A1G6JK80_9PSEU|nr:hypothetical protein [Actinokineospora iranica]SDC19159.1 hypothetical protein SAMN05216174_101447 [Actinokineospora iranica]